MGEQDRAAEKSSEATYPQAFGNLPACGWITHKLLDETNNPSFRVSPQNLTAHF
jgi:hypothetical protein